MNDREGGIVSTVASTISPSSSSGASTPGVGDVHLKMISRNIEEGDPIEGIPIEGDPIDVSVYLLWLTSVHVFARYLKRANGSYSLFTNNCQHFCDNFIERLRVGVTDMPDGYELENPVQVGAEPETWHWILTNEPD